MRFFISSNIKSNTPLHVTVVFFLLSALLFWFLSWLFYHYKFGLTYDAMFVYFFTDKEFPEKLPLSQLLEDIHIQLFIQITYLLVVVSIFLHKHTAERLRTALVIVAFLSALGDILLSLGVYFLSPLLIYPKILFFVLFQLSVGIMLLLSLKLFLSREKEKAPDRGLLYSVVFIFAFATVILTLLNFFLFVSKMGFSPISVAQYYEGNPQAFVRPKSLEGMLLVMVPHTIAMTLYLFTLIHFAFFTNLSKKTLLSFLVLSFALLDNFSGLMIRYVDGSLAYLKLLSFSGLSLMMLYLSLAVIVSILKHRAKSVVVL